MRQAILIMLLAVVSGSAAAEWAVVVRTDISTAYVDSATIRRQGNKVKILSLIDFRASRPISGNAYWSRKEQYEFDCKEERSQMLSTTFHAGHMGEGDVIATTDGSGNGQSISPGSIAESLWQFACGKR
jgi:hypothetical protein